MRMIFDTNVFHYKKKIDRRRLISFQKFLFYCSRHTNRNGASITRVSIVWPGHRIRNSLPAAHWTQRSLFGQWQIRRNTPSSRMHIRNRKSQVSFGWTTKQLFRLAKTVIPKYGKSKQFKQHQRNISIEQSV